MFQLYTQEKGQGLTEYALLLVLVAVVVVGILTLLGPQVGGVFSEIVEVFDGGIIVSAAAARTGGGNGNDVVVTVTVSENTTITATDSQSGGSRSTACSSSCQVTLTGVGHNAGSVSITAGTDSASTGYPAKN